MKLDFFSLFSDFCATEWASLVNKHAFSKAFFAKNMFAVCLNWEVIVLMAD